jgi:SAM-dependent methyltransferase
MVVDLLCEVAEVARPRLVVDLGCGTGLSTRLWAGRAAHVIGIEPSDDMRRQAEAATTPPEIVYRRGWAERVEIEDASADVVTCVQSFHWMDPEATLREAARCLRRGGVFAAIDCDWPPLVRWELDEMWHALHDQADRLVGERSLAVGLRRCDKRDHIERMRRCGRFRFVKEVAVHQRDQGDAERLVTLARSQGGVATCLKAGVTEVARSLAALSCEAGRVLGTRVVPWTYTYRVRLAVK